MADRAARAADDLLAGAVERHVFPAATAEVGDSTGPLWSGAYGSIGAGPGAPHTTADVIFDLASLTKPIATTSLALGLVARRTLGLDDKLSGVFDQWRGDDREAVTVQDVLEHASGLPARLLDRAPDGPPAFLHDICATPLEYPPRSRSIYSDLGFILLGFLVEDRGGSALAAQFDDLCRALGIVADRDLLRYDVPVDLRARTAPTRPLPDDVRRGRVLQGEVHDDYATRLGGVAGHAGLFGSASGVGLFARAVLRAALGDLSLPLPFTPRLVERMTTRSVVPGSSRGLGWDTMLPTSSCGTGMSPSAFGHVGFTGTSLWIDPVLDRYFVLLTNRACGGGSLDDMRQVRRAFHDIVTQLGF